MIIERLVIEKFRNFDRVELLPHPQINAICGGNGSGKTSLLEAIYYLSVGRSFRTHLTHRVIQYQQDKLTLFSKLKSTTLGIERYRNGTFRLKMADKRVDTIATLAKVLPIQLINPDGYRLLGEGPKFRRDFLYWGLFYGKEPFFSLWCEMQRILKQRNIALRQRVSKQEVIVWDHAFVKLSEKVTVLIKQYVTEFNACFFSLLPPLLNIPNVEIQYSQGWSSNSSLVALLQQTFEIDQNAGYTHYGPHRANLVITVDGVPAKDRLSRGQQKLFVYTMRLAQGILLRQMQNKGCLYLIDDLPAELDSERRQALFTLLMKLKGQVFVTAIEPTLLAPLLQSDKSALFHVKQGTFISELSS